MTIVEFLRARHDEREAALKRIAQPYRLYACDDGHLSEPFIAARHDSPDFGQYERWADGDDRLPNHHNSWELVFDPAHELREVEAKRQILEAHRMETHWCPMGDGLFRVLALPYSDHPDYDPTWSQA